MKRFYGLLFSLIVFAGAAAVATAQDMPPQGPPPGGPTPGGMRMQMQMPTFADMDKNKDKKITRDELPAQFPPQFFDRLDANKDGAIDEDEFNAMRRFGGPGGGPRFGESLTKFLDADHDGSISRDEFAKMTSLFDSLDQDHNGNLSQEELNGFFRAVNDAHTQATGGVDASRLFANLDKNKDGKVTPDEMTDEKMFKNLDINKDGAVTREEAEQALKQMAERSKQKKQAQPQAPNQ